MGSLNDVAFIESGVGPIASTVNRLLDERRSALYAAFKAMASD